MVSYNKIPIRVGTVSGAKAENTAKRSGEVGRAHTFCELLPPGCPPPDAKLASRQIVYGLTKSDPPTHDDFRSHAALQIPRRPNCDLCSHASCSAAVSEAGRQSLIDLSKTSFWKKKKSFIAYLEIDERTGKTKFSAKSTHVDIWMFSGFDPVAAVNRSEELG